MNEACNVTTALSAFSSISLEEMSTIRLMNRTDTKYIVSLSALMDVLQRASNCYRVQEVQGERNIAYHTTYLDTPDYAMYLAHQNGRVIREKIRVRTYVSSGLTFLEVKKKIFSELPPHSEYSITETGKSLLPIIEQLEEWGDHFRPTMKKLLDMEDEIQS